MNPGTLDEGVNLSRRCPAFQTNHLVDMPFMYHLFDLGLKHVEKIRAASQTRPPSDDAAALPRRSPTLDIDKEAKAVTMG